jgi:signal peptide peptidase SppA
MFDLKDTLWVGSLASLEAAKAAEMRFLSADVSSRSDEDDAEPVLLKVVGNVGVIAIKGPLVNANIPESYLEWYGVTTYSAIRHALVSAVQNPAITKILLDINSPGGAVSGITETADLLAQINSDHKPVHTFADGAMASGGYWLGVTARTVASSRSAVLGSIGVIMTHMEYTEKLKADGISATVFRSGKYKALGQPAEKLTEAASDQIQSRMDSVYEIFIEHVASQRGVTTSKADTSMGQGREFFGQEAVDAGLSDKISTFEKELSALQDKAVANVRFKQLRSNSMAKATLTEAQIAAMAEGADLGLSVEILPLEDSVKTDLTQVQTGTEEVEVTTDEAKVETKTGDDSVVKYLQGELATLRDANRDQHVELVSLTDKVKGLEAVKAPLEEIARASVRGMQVALGFPASDLSTLNGDRLLAEHSRVAADFKQKFKVGGVAATTGEADVEVKAVDRDAPSPAAIRSVRFNKGEVKNG